MGVYSSYTYAAIIVHVHGDIMRPLPIRTTSLFLAGMLLAAAPVSANWFSDRYKGIKENIKIMQNKDALKQRASALRTGDLAPDFALPAPDGSQVALSSFRGHPTVLMFWASWCPACIEESKHLVAHYDRLSAAGIRILGVSLDRDKSAWQDTLRRLDIEWAQASDLKGVESPVAVRYGVYFTPTTFVLDGEGRIVAKYATGKTLIADLEKITGKKILAP